MLSNVQPDFDQLNYQSKHQGGLKMVFKRVSAERPPKPATTNSGADKPFQLIEIQGNIRKCFGCGLLLKDGPSRRSVDPLDSNYLRHQEQDHSEKHWKWIPKWENKHFHIAKECVLNKNQQFQASTVKVCLSHTLTSNFKTFLSARLTKMTLCI